MNPEESEPLLTERLPDGCRLLRREFRLFADGVLWVIENGARTDYSTIPAAGRALVRWSKVDLAGVVHDYMYLKPRHSRSRADRVWRIIAMQGEHRANWFQAWVGWLALRAFGGIAWARHRGTPAAKLIAGLQVAWSLGILVVLVVIGIKVMMQLLP